MDGQAPVSGAHPVPASKVLVTDDPIAQLELFALDGAIDGASTKWKEPESSGTVAMDKPAPVSGLHQAPVSKVLVTDGTTPEVGLLALDGAVGSTNVKEKAPESSEVEGGSISGTI
jgi:hypothetical protein